MEQAGSTMADVVGALSTGMSTVATSALNAIGTMVPIAAPVMGAVLVIGIGIRTFKKIAK